MSNHPTRQPFWRPLALTLLIVVFSSGAHAQWLWIDGSGAKVFSDTAPPAGIPDKNILKRPGPPVEVKEVPTAPATAAAPVPKVTGQDAQLEARKKQAEKQAEEAAQALKKAETDKFAKARADNCESARRAKATMDSGIRVATTNAKGEREIMDDKARAAETRRIEGIIRSDCGPLPAPGPAAKKTAN